MVATRAQTEHTTWSLLVWWSLLVLKEVIFAVSMSRRATAHPIIIQLLLPAQHELTRWSTDLPHVVALFYWIRVVHLVHTHKFLDFRPTLYAQIMMSLWQQYIGIIMQSAWPPTPFGAHCLCTKWIAAKPEFWFITASFGCAQKSFCGHTVWSHFLCAKGAGVWRYLSICWNSTKLHN